MWWMAMALAETPDGGCPEDARRLSTEACSICVDGQGRLEGPAVAAEDGQTTRWVGHGGRVVEETVSYAEDGQRTVATPRRWSARSMEVSWCDLTFTIHPTTDYTKPAMTLYDAAGAERSETEFYGKDLRMYQTVWFGDDGRIVGLRTGRRLPEPDAHMRGHWTDGYYGRRDHGPWMYEDETGGVEDGRFRRGQPVGRWTVTRQSGDVAQTGRYNDGAAHGRWSCLDEDGSSASGRYRDGRRVGSWVWLDAAGGTVAVVR
ncbi:MAG: hypothetical protein KC621_17235 [Myxococcales bacterium]|nr:hypothetical protein [Myxococcales bacterium]